MAVGCENGSVQVNHAACLLALGGAIACLCCALSPCKLYCFHDAFIMPAEKRMQTIFLINDKKKCTSNGRQLVAVAQH